MKYTLLLIAVLIRFPVVHAQPKIRPVEELINTKEPGWAVVQEMISKATNKVEVLPVDTLKAREALYHTQVTTRSPMGAIIYGTGGLLIDNGWIRILGSGSSRLTRTVPDWNKGKSYIDFGEAPTYLLVADDAAGGFFALNASRLGNDPGNMYYLSPDNLDWEPLGINYTAFLGFCFNGNLDEFYQGIRWNNWKTDVANLQGDMVYTFAPLLWTKDGKDVNKDARSVVPIEEQFRFVMAARDSLKKDKK